MPEDTECKCSPKLQKICIGANEQIPHIWDDSPADLTWITKRSKQIQDGYKLVEDFLEKYCIFAETENASDAMVDALYSETVEMAKRAKRNHKEKHISETIRGKKAYLAAKANLKCDPDKDLMEMQELAQERSAAQTAPTVAYDTWREKLRLFDERIANEKCWGKDYETAVHYKIDQDLKGITAPTTTRLDKVLAIEKFIDLSHHSGNALGDFVIGDGISHSNCVMAVLNCLSEMEREKTNA